MDDFEAHRAGEHSPAPAGSWSKLCQCVLHAYYLTHFHNAPNEVDAVPALNGEKMASHIDNNLPEVQKFVIALKFKSHWSCFHVHFTAFI